MASPLVSTDWLAEHLDTVRIVDASWTMPADARDPAAEFLDAHIPGAVFFDINAIADHASPLPHMLPGAQAFAAAMRALGLDDHDKIIVYDGAGIFSAPRAWWMLRAMGHDNVFVLDGGLLKWRAEDRPLASGPAHPTPAIFTARPQPALMRDFDQMKVNLQSRAAQILDARSAPRFRGEEAEPRPGLRAGHMPGARNIPWRSLLTTKGTLKDDEALHAIFKTAMTDPRAPIVTTCGSGITAAIVMLALEQIGARDVALYDGSWAEWGARDDAPIETG